jgi:hypothetical protein
MPAPNRPPATDKLTSQNFRMKEQTYWSHAKMRFQSLFMLMTTQPRLLAHELTHWTKVPDDRASSALLDFVDSALNLPVAVGGRGRLEAFRRHRPGVSLRRICADSRSLR